MWGVVSAVCTFESQRRLWGRSTAHSINVSLLCEVWNRAWHLPFITRGTVQNICRLQPATVHRKECRCLRWIGMDSYTLQLIFTHQWVGQPSVFSDFNAFLCVYMLFPGLLSAGPVNLTYISFWRSCMKSSSSLAKLLLSCNIVSLICIILVNSHLLQHL